MKRRLLLLAGGSLAIAFLFSIFTFKSCAPVRLIGPARVKPQIAVSGHHVLLLAPDGSLWTWGEPFVGSAQPGSSGRTFGLRRLGAHYDWKSISLGWSDALALRTNGTLWQWDLSSRSKKAPRQISVETNWQEVAAGAAHFVALKADGTLWVWGDNSQGQNGSTTTKNEGMLSQIEGTNWAHVAAGDFHTAAIRRDGTLWAWGRLGYPSAPWRATQFGCESNWVAISATAFEFLARKSDGSCWMGGSGTPWLRDLIQAPEPLPPGGLARFKEIESWNSVALGSCALGLRSDGTLHGVGMNWAGVLGDGPRRVRKGPLQIGERRDWVAIGASGWAVAGMTADGSVWAWGQRLDKLRRRSKLKQFAAHWLGKWGVQVKWDLNPEFELCPRPERILQFRVPDSNGTARTE